MLAVSAISLSSATYAWFTMNKDVSVTGMQLKAHAEEGLLINEVAAWDDTNWDEHALAGDSTPTSLRPASTYDLQTWWHANSSKANNEAGASGTTGTTVDPDTVLLTYENISPNNLSTEIFNGSGTAGSAAEKRVYYANATFGTSGANGNSYDDGEGYYARYTYYLKSSKTGNALTVTQGNLKATVTATKINNDNGGSGSGSALDGAIRVGIQVGSETSANYNIFAPVAGATTEYSVAGSTSGTTYQTVTAATAEASINPDSAVDIPSVRTNGIPVYVYVWYEGEDANCKSANLQEILDSYQIDVTFSDADLG